MYLEISLRICKCDFCGAVMYPTPTTSDAVMADKAGWDWMTGLGHENTTHACSKCVYKPEVVDKLNQLRREIIEATATGKG